MVLGNHGDADQLDPARRHKLGLDHALVKFARANAGAAPERAVFGI